MWVINIRSKFFIWEERTINIVCFVQMGAKDINLTLFQGKQSMGLKKLWKYTIKISVVEQENLGLA